MKTRFLKNIFYSVLFAGLFVGCANDDDYGTPNSSCEDQTSGLTANISGADLYAMANASLQQFPFSETGEDYLEAYITSSDRGGNFFKTLSAETADGRGFSIAVDVSNTYTKGYDVGRKIFIRLNGIYFHINHGSLALGEFFVNNSGFESAGRIPEEKVADYILLSCNYISETSLTHEISITEAKNNSYINKLIKLNNVEFAQTGVPFFDTNNQIGGATNRIIRDGEDNNVIFRTGSFATYAGNIIPNNSGSVTGVMTKFNNDFQFVSRDEADIVLDQDPLGEEPEEPEEPGEPGENETSLGGTDIQYLSAFTEDFESYEAGVVNYNPGPATTFPKYINDVLAGPRYWSITSFGGNNYIQMSAHNTNSQCKAYFIVPANLTNATLSFKTKDGYFNGDALKVYYTTDYAAHSDLADATLIDITSNFAISTGSTGGYANNFTNSGSHTISAGGNGFIVFEYSGAHPSGVTTTYQIDDIVVE